MRTIVEAAATRVRTPITGISRGSSRALGRAIAQNMSRHPDTGHGARRPALERTLLQAAQDDQRCRPSLAERLVEDARSLGEQEQFGSAASRSAQLRVLLSVSCGAFRR